jgi:hypothetical protein
MRIFGIALDSFKVNPPRGTNRLPRFPKAGNNPRQERSWESAAVGPGITRHQSHGRDWKTRSGGNTPMIERMPCRPLIAVFDEPTDKLSVNSPARLYPEPDQAGIGIASECCRYEHRNLADLSIPSEYSSQPGKGFLAQIA